MTLPLRSTSPIMDAYESWDEAARNHSAGAFPTEVLRLIERMLPGRIRASAETGCGKSTILFSNASDHHTVFCLDDRDQGDSSSVEFFRRCPVSRLDRLELVYGPTQRTLPHYQHTRRYELPLLHLAAACVPAGRGLAGEAERHAALAEEAAASLDYGQERLFAGMARALFCQAAGDYLGMADALSPWQDDAVLDNRTRLNAVLWRPLLAEGLIGTGFPFRDREGLDAYNRLFSEMTNACAGLRRPGAAALDLANVAAGRLDGFFEQGINAWDVAAGSLLITEAGGLVGNYTGDSEFLHLREIVACNPKMYAQMVPILSKYSRTKQQAA